MVHFKFIIVAYYILIFLYTKMQPLSWSQTTFGYYMGGTHVAKAFGMLLVLPLLKRCGVKDTYLLMIALITQTICGFILGWSKTTWMVFLGLCSSFTY